jgi:hypothetical protein
MRTPKDSLAPCAVFLENTGARAAPAPDIEIRIGKIFRPGMLRMPRDRKVSKKRHSCMENPREGGSSHPLSPNELRLPNGQGSDRSVWDSPPPGSEGTPCPNAASRVVTKKRTHYRKMSLEQVRNGRHCTVSDMRMGRRIWSKFVTGFSPRLVIVAGNQEESMLIPVRIECIAGDLAPIIDRLWLCQMQGSSTSNQRCQVNHPIPHGLAVRLCIRASTGVWSIA